MKTNREECEKKFAERKLVMSDEKCRECEYLYLCPFMAQAMDEVVYGSD